MPPTELPDPCDNCQCDCHSFEVCKRFTIDRGDRIRELGGLIHKSTVEVIGQSCYSDSVLPYFSSSFLALYVEQDELKSKSELIPGSRQVSILFGQDKRVIGCKGPFRSQKGQVILSTTFIGGRRRSKLDDPIVSALRQFDEEVGFLLEKANVPLSEIQALAEDAWNQDQLLTHICKFSAQLTMFLRVPESMMQKLADATPSFTRCGRSEVQSAVLMSEDQIIQQFAKFMRKKQQNRALATCTDNEPLEFVAGDIYQFSISALLDMQNYCKPAVVA